MSVLPHMHMCRIELSNSSVSPSVDLPAILEKSTLELSKEKQFLYISDRVSVVTYVHVLTITCMCLELSVQFLEL